MSLSRHRELLVLSTIGAHPMHGYRLVEVLKAGLGGAVGLKQPAVYAILRRLHERAWIERETEREGRAAERSVFTITPDGRHALGGLAEAVCDDDATPLTPLVVSLAHLDLIPENRRRPVLQRLWQTRLQRLSALAAFDGHPGLAGAAFDLMARTVQAEIDVLRGLLGNLDSAG